MKLLAAVLEWWQIAGLFVGGVLFWTGVIWALLKLDARQKRAARWGSWRSHLTMWVSPQLAREADTGRRVLLYADAKGDAGHGDEDPPVYSASTRPVPLDASAPPATPLTPIVQHWLRRFRRYARRTGRISPRLGALRAIIEDVGRSGELTPAESDALWKAAEAQVLAAAAKHARPKIGRRHDGIRLGDEATRELLDEIFGPDVPT